MADKLYPLDRLHKLADAELEKLRRAVESEANARDAFSLTCPLSGGKDTIEFSVETFNNVRFRRLTIAAGEHTVIVDDPAKVQSLVDWLTHPHNKVGTIRS